MSAYDEVHFYLNRAHTNYKEKNYIKSTELLTQAIELIRKYDFIAWDEEEIWARRIRSSCYLETKEFDKSIQDADIAIRQNPNVAFIWAVRGEAYLYKNEIEQALENLSIAIELDPKYIYAIGLRGACHHQIGNYDLALADFHTRLKLTPNDAWVIAKIGVIYKSLGNHQKAIDEFKKALAIDGTMSWVKENLEKCEQIVRPYHPDDDIEHGDFDDHNESMEEGRRFMEEMYDLGLTDEDFEGRD